MTKKNKTIIAFGLLGLLTTLFFKVIPVKLWNIEHTIQSIMWTSGLSNYPIIHLIFLTMVIGFSAGCLIGMVVSIFVKEVKSNKKEIKKVNGELK